jgi:hypothetical protein
MANVYLVACVVALEVAAALEVTWLTFLMTLFVTVLSTELISFLSKAGPEVLQAETKTSIEEIANILYILFMINEYKFKLIIKFSVYRF